jgi:hypothetical protein
MGRSGSRLVIRRLSTPFLFVILQRSGEICFVVVVFAFHSPSYLSFRNKAEESVSLRYPPQVLSANTVSKSPFAFRHGFRLFRQVVDAMKNCEEIRRIETFLRQLLAAYFSCLASFPVISYV